MREMKDSGIEWIGQIPKDWKIIKGKYVLEYLQKPVKDDDGVITCFRDGEVTLRSNRREDGFTLSDKEIGYQGIDVGDLVVHGMDGFAGAIGISDSRGKASPVLNVFNSKYSKRYLMYYLRSMAFSNVFIALASGIRVRSCDLSWNKLANLPYPTTSYEEQTEIVRYIDSQCSEIDATAEDIQKEISLLEDYKKSVITEAVTKGLNPDAEMKDSGIEWIGEVPKHWGTIRIGNAFSIRNERNYLPMEQVQLLSLYSGKGVFPTGEEGTTNRGNHAQTVADYKIVKKNDIVVNIILAWMGSLGISNYNGVVSPAYDVYIPNEEKVVPHYYHYVFRTSGIANECYRYGRGIMMMRWRTYSSEFKRIHVPFPPLEEQQQIADYLDTKCSEIDAIIADKKRQRDILAEYKKSLIYEYVTGKKEVPVHE